MKLYSHPRSGTNYARALLDKAFLGAVTLGIVKTGHWSDRQRVLAPLSSARGLHPFYRPQLERPRVYLVRDGRDVALSLWRTKQFQHAAHRGLSFSEFVRTPLDWHETPGRRAAPELTIVQHWRMHLDSWRGAPHTLVVRYEELLQDPAGQLARIAGFTGERLLSTADPVGDVGPFPSGDYRAGKWRDAFTADDLAYFHSIVPQGYWGLYD